MTKIHAINSNDRDWTRNRYLIGLGAYGWTVLLVWANGLEDAIEECAEWCADNAPGLLADTEVAEEYQRCFELGKMDASLTEEENEEQAYEQATVDTISCDQGHYFHSWEVNLISENPTRAEILEITGNPEKGRVARIAKAKRTGRPFPKNKPRKVLTVVTEGAKVQAQ